MSAPDQHLDAVARAVLGGRGMLPLRPDESSVILGARVEARAILDSTDPAVHAAMLDALTRHGVLTEEHGYIPVDETGATWKMRSLKEALEVADNCPVGDTYGDGAPRPGIATIEHGVRYQSAWKIVGEVSP